MKKIITRKQLPKLVHELKRKGNIIVTTNGCFDLLHAGHAVYMEEAKAQGDILIVGVNTNHSVKMNKGKGRPIISQKYRARLLCAFKDIDYVTFFDEKTPIKLLSIIRPHVHVNGSEYGYNCIEAPIVKKYGGKIYLVKRRRGLATTKIIERIKKLM